MQKHFAKNAVLNRATKTSISQTTTMDGIDVRKYLSPPKEDSTLSFIFSIDRKDEMLEAFTLFDKDGDGLISTKEISKVMRALGQIITVCEETDIVAQFAQENCHEIDFIAFYRLMGDWRKEFDEDNELRESFRRFDKGENGYVDASEMKKLLTTVGEPLTEDEVNEWLEDGKKFTKKRRLFYEEFATYMLSK